MYYPPAKFGWICQKWPDAKPAGAGAEIQCIPTLLTCLSASSQFGAGLQSTNEFQGAPLSNIDFP